MSECEYIVVGRSSSDWEVWRRWPEGEEFTQRMASCSSSLGALTIRDSLRGTNSPALPADLPQEPRNAAPWPAADLSQRALPQPPHPVWGSPAPGTHENDLWDAGIDCPFKGARPGDERFRAHVAEHEIAAAWSRAHATKEGQ